MSLIRQFEVKCAQSYQQQKSAAFATSMSDRKPSPLDPSPPLAPGYIITAYATRPRHRPRMESPSLRRTLRQGDRLFRGKGGQCTLRQGRNFFGGHAISAAHPLARACVGGQVPQGRPRDPLLLRRRPSTRDPSTKPSTSPDSTNSPASSWSKTTATHGHPPASRVRRHRAQTPHRDAYGIPARKSTAWTASRCTT